MTTEKVLFTGCLRNGKISHRCQELADGAVKHDIPEFRRKWRGLHHERARGLQPEVRSEDQVLLNRESLDPWRQKFESLKERITSQRCPCRQRCARSGEHEGGQDHVQEREERLLIAGREETQ